MHKAFYTFLLLFLVSAVLGFAQNGDQNSRTSFYDGAAPITVDQSSSVIFMDDFNGDNTVAGLQSRGWVVLNEDGGGTTDPYYQGSIAVFNAYEGPDTGYVASNYNGANPSGVIDQWLISPEVTVQAGDTLRFWHRSPDANPFDDSIFVKYSTTAGVTPADFDVSWGRFLVSETGWSQFVGTFTTGGTFRFAIQYYIFDGGPVGSYSNYIGIDYVEVAGSGGGGFTTYFEDFDGFTVGANQVACQDPVNWTTWSNAPCGAEDGDISSNFSYTPGNSALINPNDDLVKPLGNLTSGKYYMSFLFYIPAGKSGYFNTMNEFNPPTFVWGMDAFFDVGGTGRLDTAGAGGGGATVVPFSWTVGQWNQVIVVVDLDNQMAEFWVGTDNPLTQIATWDWTQNGTKPNVLAVNDFFGAAATDEMYMDNYYFSDTPPVIIPVELTSFTAASVNGTVQLNWATATELNNQMFEIERKAEGSQYVKIGFVNGHGTTTEPQQYSYSDNNVTPGKYYYRLKQVDFQGTFQYSPEVEVDVTTPLVFALEQNYPNPFNPSTLIRFSIAEPSFVKLAIYNALGEEIKVLKNEFMQAGYYEESFNAAGLSSGVYFYSIETPQFNTTKKMILTK